MVHKKDISKIFTAKIKFNEPMFNHTTLEIGGMAKYYIDVSNQDELVKLVKASIENDIKFIIIGEGSNLLVSDEGFDGLVIKNRILGIEVTNQKVKVKSGTNLLDLINKLNSYGLSGMEKMAGIPGTVGGAICGNAGAYGQAISDNLISVKVFDGRKIKTLEHKDCGFGYRDSVFKINKNTILGAVFEFEKGAPEVLKKTSLNTIQLRLQKYPQGLKCPGSFFKNVMANSISKRVLMTIPKEKIIYEKIPAGYLMEAVGAKGSRKGDIKISDYHGNLLINTGKGKALDFYELAEKYAKKVERRFGIKLEPEVQLVGFGKSTIL